MLGYLNHPSPFTEDGWIVTGDMVSQRGEYIKFLGRQSEIINVGGEKVFPAEVENCILAIDNVEDVTVYPEKNAILGNIVCAKISTTEAEEEKRLFARIKETCRKQLSPYKVPVKIEVAQKQEYSARFKKLRIPNV
jgi:acyl-CoA synthetase (AMP-forming)/AMP-acid ligase II